MSVPFVNPYYFQNNPAYPPQFNPLSPYQERQNQMQQAQNTQQPAFGGMTNPQQMGLNGEIIVKENGAVVLFAQMPFTSELIHSNIKNFKYMWIWYKHYCRGFLNAKKQPLRTTENICVFYKKQCTYNPIMRKGELRQKGNSSKQRGCYGKYNPVKTINDKYYPTDILDFAGVPNSELNHPTQKPVDLLEYLIRTYTNENDTILDSCMGSGSTGVACMNTNRKFIGMELDKNYFNIAKKRIESCDRNYAGL